MGRFDSPNLDLLLNKHRCSSRAHIIRLSGQEAFLLGHSINDCPFSEGTTEHTLWEKGWRREFFDNFDVVAGSV